MQLTYALLAFPVHLLFIVYREAGQLSDVYVYMDCHYIVTILELDKVTVELTEDCQSIDGMDPVSVYLFLYCCVLLLATFYPV